MSNLKKQFKKISENWLLVVVFVLLLLVFSGMGLITNTLSVSTGRYASDMMAESSPESVMYRSASDSFAPEEETRLIIKNASINLEVRKNRFYDAETEIKSILTSAGAFIINENVNENDKGLKTGYYNVRVDSSKLDFVNLQIKTIGDLKHFSESGTDITGTHTDTSYELVVEKERLDKYNELYNSDKISYSEKVDLIDKISYQERRVKYLEDSLNRLDERIAYSTLNISLREVSSYANIEFFKFSALVKTLVGSINSLFFILFAVLPYAIAIYLIVLLIRLFKKKPKRK
jgi:hypothetical protein